MKKKKIEYLLKKKNQKNLVALLAYWYLTKIYCDNKLIYEIKGTQKILNTEIWSENHPFFVEYYKNSNFFKENIITMYDNIQILI